MTIHLHLPPTEWCHFDTKMVFFFSCLLTVLCHCAVFITVIQSIFGTEELSDGSRLSADVDNDVLALDSTRPMSAGNSQHCNSQIRSISNLQHIMTQIQSV